MQCLAWMITYMYLSDVCSINKVIHFRASSVIHHNTAMRDIYMYCIRHTIHHFAMLCLITPNSLKWMAIYGRHWQKLLSYTPIVWHNSIPTLRNSPTPLASCHWLAVLTAKCRIFGVLLDVTNLVVCLELMVCEQVFNANNRSSGKCCHLWQNDTKTMFIAIFPPLWAYRRCEAWLGGFGACPPRKLRGGGESPTFHIFNH